jgi:hypothetical protein
MTYFEKLMTKTLQKVYFKEYSFKYVLQLYLLQFKLTLKDVIHMKIFIRNFYNAEFLQSTKYSEKI